MMRARLTADSRLSRRLLLWSTGVLASTLVVAAPGRFRPVAAQEGTPEPGIPTVGIVAEGETTRTLRHSAGETDVPVNPQRIVALADPLVDAVLALGVTPAAVATFRGSGYRTYLEDWLEGVPEVGYADSIDLEAVLAAEPDLILVDTYGAELSYDQLSKIAPTVAFDAWTDTRANQREVGLAIGKAEDAEARIAAYDETVATARGQLDAAVGDETVAFLRIFQRELRLEGGTGETGPMLFGELGLTPAGIVEPLMDTWAEVLSLEMVPQIDADHLFVQPEIDSDEYYEELLSSPLWQEVPAVRNGNVYVVDRWTHWLTRGILAGELAIADVMAALAPEDSATPTA
ncbi:MAG: iron-siderophore ABC transporter substrate-binding protein [Thermomicrobiales bacterium]|nr:iron-siderophore ABC transporter substrate-binding protein [Thermomicrobiales bacterium]